MDNLKENFLTLVILIGGSQLFAFFIDFLKWAVRKKHPARIEKSEDVKYPQYLNVSVWSDSHYFHGYKKITYIRKGDNKYKKEMDHSVGGWIRRILINLLYMIVTFALPIGVFFYSPDYPYPENLFGCSAFIFFMILHAELTGSDTVARIELNKYLKAQDR